MDSADYEDEDDESRRTQRRYFDAWEVHNGFTHYLRFMPLLSLHCCYNYDNISISLRYRDNNAYEGKQIKSHLKCDVIATLF